MQEGQAAPLANITRGDVMVVRNSLSEIRKATGLSQEEVAKIFREKYCMKQITRQQISLWERGTLPNIEFCLILSEIYKKTVNELFELA